MKLFIEYFWDSKKGLSIWFSNELIINLIYYRVESGKLEVWSDESGITGNVLEYLNSVDLEIKVYG